MPLLSLDVWVARIEKERGRQEWETLWEYYRNVKIKTYFQRSCREDGSKVFRVAEGGHKDALFYGDKYGLEEGAVFHLQRLLDRPILASECGHHVQV